MLLDVILDCSDKILVDSCSDDISREKKVIEDFFCFSNILLAALNAIFVAKAVFPIEGLPAIITKSDLCSPPSMLSRSLRPVGTPTMPSSFLYAEEAIAIVSTKASLNSM